MLIATTTTRRNPMKNRLTLSVAAIALLLNLSSAFADEASDREEIEALLWNYTRALDTINADAYASVFTEDGAFTSGNTALTTGHEALKGMIAGVKKGQDDRAA